MKITGVACLPCRLPIEAAARRLDTPVVAGGVIEMALIRITTDAGLIGWGESFAYLKSAATVRTATNDLIASRLIGAVAGDPAQIFEKLRRELHPLGASGPVLAALSGVEVALWDLAGKAAGVPVHRLLGDARAESLGCYASLPRYGDRGLVEAACIDSLEHGFNAVKLHEADIAITRAAIRTMRTMRTPRQSNTMPLTMLDVNCRWDFDEAMAACDALRDEGLAWIEEPIAPPDDYPALARLRRRGVPIAAGENASAATDFAEMIRVGAVDILQPSIAKIGGIDACRSVMRTGQQAGIQVAPHSPFFGPALAATIHLCAAVAPQTAVESYRVDFALNPFPIAPRRGRFAVPVVPGLGCDPDPEILEKVLG